MRFAVYAVFVIAISCVQGGAQVLRSDVALEQLADLEERVVARLSRDEILTDTGRHAELLELLKVVGRYRMVEAVPVLVRHIAFSAILEEGRLVPLETEYPAAAALWDIGVPAVPALVERIAQDRDTVPKAANLALVSIAKIYDVGGGGSYNQKLWTAATTLSGDSFSVDEHDAVDQVL
jgi:hypothetical protein